jgi:hypothetical protein
VVIAKQDMQKEKWIVAGELTCMSGIQVFLCTHMYYGQYSMIFLIDEEELHTHRAMCGGT